MQYFEHEEDLYALDSDSLSARVGDLVLVRRLEKPHQKNVQHKVESIVQRLGDFRDYQVRKKEVQKYSALLVFFCAHRLRFSSWRISSSANLSFFTELSFAFLQLRTFSKSNLWDLEKDIYFYITYIFILGQPRGPGRVPVQG